VNTIVDPFHVGDKEMTMAVVGRRLRVGFEFCPTGETLLARDDELGVV